MRPPPLSADFPRLSHRINVLTSIFWPCVAWHCLKVEQAMGIEYVAREPPTQVQKGGRFDRGIEPAIQLSIISRA
jgi:uncharacterized membrane protein